MEQKTDYKSLIDALKHNSNHGDKGIIFVNSGNEDKFLSYKELYDKALQILNNFQEKGIHQGDEIVFQIQDERIFLLNFWACILGGIIPVPVSVGNNDEHKLKLFKIWRILNHPYLITDDKILDSLQHFTEKGEIDVIGEIASKTLFIEECLHSTSQGKVYNAGLNDIAFVQFSSGSTSDPKGVVLTHENLLTNIWAMMEYGKVQKDDSFLSWMPLTHDMGMIMFHLTPCIANTNQCIIPTSLFIRTPMLWMEKANEYQFTRTASPNFGYRYFKEHFKPEKAKNWDLSYIRSIFNGAEPISPELCDEFLNSMASYGLKRTTMCAVYGLAEATVGVAAPLLEEEVVTITLARDSINLGEPVKECLKGEYNTTDFVDLGYTIKDCFLRVCDGENNPIGENIIGYIQIKGKNVTKGYYNNLEATERVIHDGWLDTGDVGFIRKGRLVITGRAKDIIFINGQNYYPHDIERVSEDIKGVELGYIASCGVFNKNIQTEEIILFVLFKRKLEDFVSMVKELKAHISNQMGLTITHVIPVKKMPKTTSGKIQRYKLGEMYLNGEFTSVIEQIEQILRKEIDEGSSYEATNEIEEKLLKIWREVFNVEKISAGDDFFALGGNSLKAAQVTSILHRELNLEVPISEIFYNPTIKQLGEYVEKAKARAYSSIFPVEQKEVYEASPAQKRLFALNQFSKEDTNYNIPYGMLVEGLLQKDRVEEIFKRIVERHEALRTSFEVKGEEILQRIHMEVGFYVEFIETSEKPEEIKEIIQDFIRPFDLSKAPLLRVRLIRLGEEKHILMLDMHHIISDGASMEIIRDEFITLYRGEALKELRIQYKDYSAWQNELLDSETMLKQEEYWMKVFENEIPVLDIPTDYPRPTLQSFDGSSINFKIHRELAQKIKKVGNDNRASLYMMLLSVYNILLSRYSGQEDIIIGSPIAGRSHADLKGVVGMFVNTLAMRNYPKVNKTFREFLQEVRKNALGAYENHEYQFDELVEKLDIQRDLSRNPLFDITFVLQNMDINEIEIDCLKFNFYEFENKMVKFDLNLSAIEIGEEIGLSLEYSTKLFKRETVERIAKHFINIFEEIAANPEIRLSEIDMLSEKEKKRILVDLNNTETGYPRDKTIQELFEEQVNRTPEHVAVVCEGEELTYRELNDKAGSLARGLRGKGVGPDSITAIIMEKSLDMMVGIMGVLKAGGAYLPIDPKYPQDRIKYILEDSRTRLILSNRKSFEGLSSTLLQNNRGEKLAPEVSCKREQIIDFDALPIPDRTLIDYEKYQKYIGQAAVKNSIAIQATRGCPFECMYCHKIWPKNHVVRSAENIYNEIKIYYDEGIRRFVFIDDIFNFDIKNSSKLFNLIIENGLDIQIFLPNGVRADILNEDYIELMVRAGLKGIAFALETASPRLQKLIKKNINLPRFKANIEYMATRYPGIILELFSMHGFPTETEEEARLTLDFIKSIKWIHFPYFHILKIFPGTDMAELAMQNGITMEAIERSSGLAFHELPETLPFSKSFTQKCQSEVLNEYFLSKERLQKILPLQMEVLTEDEIVQKYDSYLPVHVNNFSDLLDFLGIKRVELGSLKCLRDDFGKVAGFSEKIKKYFPSQECQEDALKVLLIDLSQLFSEESKNVLYDVVEPPLGLMYLQTYINAKLPGKVRGKIVKSRIDFDNYEELKELLEKFKPDIIGIRTLTYYREFFHKTVSIIRQWGVDVPIIAGGPYATSDYVTVLRDPNVDLAILGEGELTLAELIDKVIRNDKRLPNEEVLKSVRGIAYVGDRENSRSRLNREILWVDEEMYSSSDKTNEIITSHPQNLAYIIYTSGTTGMPKGAMIEHRNVVRLLFNDNFQFDFNDKDIWTMFHSFCFDFSVWEMYGALLYGGKLVIVPKSIAQDSREFLKLLKKEKVTILNQTPVAFFNLMNEELRDVSRDLSLRYVIFGGDILKPVTLKRWKEKYAFTKLINMFGITETTVHCTYKELNDEDIDYSVSNIGKPIPTQTLYIMNQYMKLQPEGVSGEILIGGAGVGRGYLNRPELTEERFVENPYHAGEILYKSGDLGRLMTNGDYEYLGRIDHQVKIRGFRIELGEIENKLLKYEAIKEAIVLDREDKQGDKYICAYIVAQRELSTLELREYLERELPDYMIPSYFMQIEKMPLTSNGKIDRKNLPEPNGEINSGVEYVAPRNEIEEKLVMAWSGVLGIEKIGIDDDFFTLGGNSLKAIQVLSIIHQELNVEESVGEIFTNSTIRQMGEYIKKAKESTYFSIKAIEERETYKVSSAQKRLFALNQFGKEETNYNIPYGMLVEGSLDKEKFEGAFRKLVERHEALRTSFELQDEEILQRVYKEVEFNIEYEEAYEVEQEKIKEIVQKFIRSFDLSKAPLIRIKLVKIEKEKHIFMIDMHHIISDGVSMSIVMEEFAKLYKGEILEELGIQYKDYSAWQNDLLDSEGMKTSCEYWKKVFKDEIPVLDIPTDYPRPILQSFEGESIGFKIDRELAEKIKQIGNESGATLYMTLLSAYNTLLFRYSGQEDIIVGSPITGRSHADLQRIVGMFVNTLVMRNYPKGEMTFKEFLQEVKRNALDAYENQDYQFDELVEKLNIPRDLSRHALCDTMFALQNTAVEEIEVGSLKFSKYEFDYKISKADLILSAVEVGEEIGFYLEYCTKLFKRETAKRIADHFINILREIAKNPEIKLSEIELLSEKEKRKVLVDFNTTKTEYPKDKTLYELFEEQAEMNPNHIAVVFEDKKLTYRELNERANKLAGTLRNKGIKSNSIVAVMVERSIEMIVSILAILKSGGTYLPIDRGYPQKRIQYMLEDSGAVILLTGEQLNQNINYKGETINVYDETSYSNLAENLEAINSSEDLAYVIYTSGSTGKPKGVMIPHYSVVRVVKHTNYIDIRNTDVVLQLSNYAFDGSVFDFYGALLNGATLVLIANETVSDINKLASIFKEKNITISFITTALFNTIVDVNLSSFTNIRKILFGGERISVSHAKKALKYLGKDRLVHVYGPTESTVYSTYYFINEINDDANIPIGKPISNTSVYILDKNRKLLPIGVPGELCIGGDGVAKSYLNKPELSNEKFLENSFEPGQRMYRTGDIGKWLPDGNIEFIGRVDQQVKIRGFRIELGEIESQLLKNEAIREAVVIDWEDKQGSKYLSAYIVANREMTILELRGYLSKELPDYMIPYHFVQIERMPLNSSGKIDRKALPKPDGDIHTGVEYVAPRNEIEEKLAVIWSNLLKVKKISIDSNFFDLGGHSLKVTRLIAEINKQFNTEILFSEVFKNPTVRQMAEYIAKSKESIYSSIQPVEEREAYEVSSAQKRMFALNQFAKEEVNYNIPVVMMVEGKLEKERIELVFRSLIKRHEAFRTSFELLGEEIVQKIHKEVEFSVEYAETNEDEAIKSITDSFIRPFDLSKAPLIRVKLVQIEEEKHILMADMHHIISDGASAGIIVEEFTKIYKGESLEALRIQYKDYSAWQNELLDSEMMKKSQEYWMKVFEAEIPVLDMPTDYPRPMIRSFEGDNIEFKISGRLVEKLKEIGSDAGATLYMTLLSAYNVLLYRYSGQEDIVVGSPIAGRFHADLEGIIGMFVNTLAMRNYPNGDKTFNEFLYEVKANALGAYQHQEYQFEGLIQSIDIRRDLSRNALFDTMFVLQNIDIKKIDLYSLKFNPFQFDSNVSKFDLTLLATETGDEIAFNLEYCTKLYKRDSVERIVEHFTNILEEVAENPEIKLSQIGMLSEKEKKVILVDFNNTEVEYEGNNVIYKLFEEQVERTPESIAVVYEEKVLTYQELNDRANSLANVLSVRGVKPGSIVGVMAEASLEAIIGIMGVLKAGGAYLPIDTEYPNERIEYMLEDSGATILLTQRQLMDTVKFDGVKIDLDDMQLYDEIKDHLQNINVPEDLAYVIYTSGSTGKPKGVMVTHQGLVNYIMWAKKVYLRGEAMDFALYSSISFDLTVTSIYTPLVSGNKIVIYNGEDKPVLVRKIVQEDKVGIIKLTPTHLNLLCDLDLSKTQVKRFIVGGEDLKAGLAKKIYDASQGRIEIFNEYGPTETVVGCMVYQYDPEKDTEGSVPIGIPADNVSIYVLDKYLMPVPIGCYGEIYVAGAGVARGYLNKEALTRERFLSNPFTPGSRMYKTGDLAKRREDGNIEYVQRLDDQVKIRGYRIELGEIESQLMKNKAIKETVVIDREDKQGNKYLCAYIIGDREMPVTELRGYLSKELPEYMIPSYFKYLEKMPLTSNGKIDKKELPEPNGDINTGVEYIAPENEIEENLAEIWSEVLGIEKIGIDDDFFALGGDSIKVIQVVSRMSRYNLKITVSEMYANSTIRELGRYVKQEENQIDQTIIKGRVELTAIQKWFLEQNFAHKYHWNQVMMLHTKEGFDKNFVAQVFTKIVEHHDALRMVIRNEENGLIQFNRGIEGKLFDLSVIDLRNQESWEREIEKETAKIQSSINLQDGPLVKLGLFKTIEGDHLLIVIHHFVIDSVSWRILLEDFATGYEQVRIRQKIELPKKTHSFKEWAENINNYGQNSEVLKEIEYWKTIENTKVGGLPKDHETASNRVLSSKSVNMKISREATEKLLKDTHKAYNTEINDILLAALGLTVKEWTGEHKVLLSLEGHGREEILPNMNITRTIGWFTSVYPVILDCEKFEDIGYYIKLVKEGMREIPNKGIGYGILKYITPKEYLNGLEFKLKPQICLNYLGHLDYGVHQGAFNQSMISTGEDISKESQRVYDINISAAVVEGELNLTCEYNKDEYNQSTMIKFIEKYQQKLLDIINHCTEKEKPEMTPSDLDYKEISIEELEDIKSTVDILFKDRKL